VARCLAAAIMRSGIRPFKMGKLRRGYSTAPPDFVAPFACRNAIRNFPRGIPMPVVSMRQLLDHAAENGYGIPAFNVNNLEQVQAVMAAADALNAPVIMQASAGARKYAGEAFLRHLIDAAIEAYPHIPVGMHQDHGQSPAVCR